MGFQGAAQTPADTLHNPKVIFTGIPRTYEIAGISVKGADNYEDHTIIGYAGLKIGERIDIPGSELTAASKRLWRQGLFSQVRIVVDKTAGDKAWITIDLRTQPRISAIHYYGVKKSERDELQERLQLHKGNQITQNIVNRAEAIIKKYFAAKGFSNANVKITLREDLSAKNEMIVDINVNKNSKVKVHKIYIDGNEVMSDNAIQRTMKKTNEKGKLLNLFKQKKFVESDFEDDLKRIIQKYNEKGYRDAKIISDSVVNYDDNTVDVYITLEEGKKYYINDISWVGNTVFPTDFLNDVLGISKGDVYNQKLLSKRMTDDDDAVANLYMNRGYLFYDLVPIERNVEGDSIDLEMRMMEGPQARINNVIINGNDRLYEKVIRRELRVKPGELFSKDDLMRSAREIAQTGHFNPENMDIRPEPNQENGTVDILFNLESKANDQIEFSLGWGQTGVIGKLALKFTNFSIKNLLHPSSYKGLIPQGEGQTFTISAQTNARYYQAYSLSFLDPWFGGKRPNSLSVSAYYSRQTGVNSSYYNSTWSNPHLYNGLNYGNLYGYGSSYNDYYQNSINNAYDPNKVLQMVGVSLGFGKRLKWPDDYFTLSAELAYQRYNLSDWQYFPVTNGKCNDLSLSLTLARNSIDNPIFPRSGSDFSLSVQITPPYSLMDGKDYKGYYSNPETGSITQDNMNKLHKWIEYHKWKFKGKTYTPLMDPIAHPKCLVLMTRTEFGLLGHYNQYKKSPFGTFDVGGDGMTGYSTYATESIALRGYENSALTPYGSEGYAYARLGIELRYPLMLETSTNIYVLGFLEAGNAWHDIKKFNPFELKRSAGVGVRIFLPMIGMMGIDWGYGFDKVFGSKQYGGSQFHFILGQEF